MRAPGSTWGTTDLSIFLPELVTKKDETILVMWACSWRRRGQKMKTRKEHVRFRKWNVETFYPRGHLLQNIAEVFLRRHTPSFPLWKGMANIWGIPAQKGVIICFVIIKNEGTAMPKNCLNFHLFGFFMIKATRIIWNLTSFLSLFSKRNILVFQTKKVSHFKVSFNVMVFRRREAKLNISFSLNH